jgi:hypothetical protein
MKAFCLILVLLLFVMLATPVSAELIVRNGNAAFNTSGEILESGYYHDSGYVPEIYVWFAIVLGLISLVVSTYVKNEINIFVLITPVFWGYAAWFTAFMEREIVSTVPGADGTIQVVYTEIVFAQPVLQYAMIFLFLASCVYAIYMLFLHENEKPLTGQQAENMAGRYK